MKEFHCGDVVPGCTAKFHKVTTDEILQSVALHARNDHGMTEIPPAIVDLVVARIREETRS